MGAPGPRRLAATAELTRLEARPRPRLAHGRATLVDVAIVSWAVTRDVVDRLLPEGVEPRPVTLDGTSAPIVSAVLYRYGDLRFRGLPFARLSCAQVHYRTYVRVGEERGVWFFGTALASRLAVLPRLLWSMPWRYERLSVDAEWSEGRCRRYRSFAEGGGAELRLAGTGRPLTAPEVSDPVVGWYPRRDEAIGRLTVWHPPAHPEAATVEEASFPVLDDLGLVERGAEPVAALVQPSLEIEVHTPPRRLRSPLRSSLRSFL